MKKSILITTLAILMPACIILGQTNNWIKTSEGDFECAKIKAQKGMINITLPNGEKKSFPASSVNSYFLNGKTFFKMPLLNDGTQKEEALMEFMNTVDGLSLYKYYDKVRYLDRFFVYKGNDLYMEIRKDVNPEFAYLFKK